MVLPIPRVKRTLTGRAQVRRGWFGRHVLQVEVRIERPESKPLGLLRWRPSTTPAGPQPVRSRTVWRDATWRDLRHSPRLVIGNL